MLVSQKKAYYPTDFSGSIWYKLTIKIEIFKNKIATKIVDL